MCPQIRPAWQTGNRVCRFEQKPHGQRGDLLHNRKLRPPSKRVLLLNATGDFDLPA
jgi:hypothetical protein